MQKKKVSLMKVITATALLLVFHSCNEEGFEQLVVNETPAPQEEGIQALSGEERAIQAFQNYLNELEKSNAITRGSATSKVIKVDKKTTASYQGNIPTTRALELSLPVYELTLQNENNTSGFAVVAECPTESKVMAYAPMGAISDTVFNKGLACFFRDFAKYTEFVMEKKKAQTRADFEVEQKYNIYDFFVGDEILRDATQEEINNNFSQYPYETPETSEMVGRFVDAMWDQGTPYNNNVSDFVDGTRDRVRVGCVPVAIGQLLSYYKTYGNYNWSLLTATPKISANTPAATEVARLLTDIATVAGTIYHTDTNMGGTPPDNIGPTIAHYGFTNFKWFSYRMSFQEAIYNDVKDNHPVLVYGSGSVNGALCAHMWIADRMWITDKYEYNVKIEKYKTPQIYKRLYRVYRAHCNWGWGNRSDGWYHTFTPVYIDGKKYDYASKVEVYAHLYN